MTDLSGVEILQIKMACAEQITKFAALNDACNYPQLAAMFIEKGVFARPSQPDNHLIGRSEILQAFNSRPRRNTVHLVSNVVVDVIDSERALAHSRIVLYAAPYGTTVAEAPVLIGAFSDELVLENGVWLFASRLGKVEMIFE